MVTVTGTDPGGVDSITDTLTCIYSDGPADKQSPTTVVYTLVMDIGGNGTFVVSKMFSDGSMGSVKVTLTCDTGLPLTQTHTISEGNPVAFVVKSYESGMMNCTVTEDLSIGYTPDYMASGESSNEDDDPTAPGCHFFDIAGGASNACMITNDPDPVMVTIMKEWIVAGLDETSIGYELVLTCDSEIVGGTPDIDVGTSSPSGLPTSWSIPFLANSASGSMDFKAMVYPDYPFTSCSVVETIEDDYDDIVDSNNGCGNIVVSANNGDQCTIINSMFFEGIPTLNQYGLAIMALLMLGIGLLGFRRFA